MQHQYIFNDCRNPCCSGIGIISRQPLKNRQPMNSRNPCCSGIGIISRQPMNRQPLKNSRNPCCSGIGIISKMKSDIHFRLFKVVILVVVELVL